MSVSFRLYQSNNLNLVRDLFVELQTYETNLLSDRADAETIFSQYWTELEQKIAEKRGEIVVAETEGVLVGFISYFVEKDILNKLPHLYISDLIVTAQHRGKGIASLLMKYAEIFAKKQKLTTVKVGVLANSAAKIFYEKQGYKIEALELIKKI